MKNVLLFTAALIVFIGCTSEKKPDMQKSQIIGTWANVSLLVTMKNLDQQDSILEAKEGEWEQVLKMKPILTQFNEDGTYSSKYTDLSEKLIKEASGRWFIRNDSLVIESDNQETVYHFKITNDRIQFKAKLDWDNDGKKDDVYDAIQVRVEK